MCYNEGMTVRTMELRVDGEQEVALTIPEADLMTAQQVIAKFVELQPRWLALNKVWSTFRERVKVVVANDFPNGCSLPNGKVMSVEHGKSISDMRSLIDYLQDAGHADLVEQVVDVRKLLKACEFDPDLAADVEPFIEDTGKGTLSIKGRVMAGYEFANTDVELASPDGGLIR